MRLSTHIPDKHHGQHRFSHSPRAQTPFGNAEVFGERQRLIEKLRAAWRVAQLRTEAGAQSGIRNAGRHEVREPSAIYAVVRRIAAPGFFTGVALSPA